MQNKNAYKKSQKIPIVCGEDVVVRQREKSFKDDHSHWVPRQETASWSDEEEEEK